MSHQSAKCSFVRLFTGPTSISAAGRTASRRTPVVVAGAKAVGAGCALAALAAGAAVLPGTAVLAAPAQAVAIPNASSHYSFTTLGDPKDPTFNQLLGINDFGEISGYFGSGSPAATHPNKGYTIAPYSGNTFTSENFTDSQQTQVTAINDWGNTVGFYALASGANYGFLDEDGVTASVSDPMTTSKPPVNQLLGVNNNGEAAGFYNDAKGNSHAYVWNRVTRVFTPVNVPGATSATATAINDHGAVGGFFTKANGNIDSFIKDGTVLKTLAVPGSTTTELFGLNDEGAAVGMYVGQHKQTFGFIYSNGALKTISDPDGVGSTVVNGLNNIGDVVGFYTDSKGNTDGFVAEAHTVGIPTIP
ncbi:MAG TPA: hypothetical protein VMF65_11965 [Acidimicrobiales bacterium]|nr:hypothetical protein [Acidimicrobiales bacterium]